MSGSEEKNLAIIQSTGRPAENEWAAAITLRDGKVARYQVYEDTAALASACGNL